MYKPRMSMELGMELIREKVHMELAPCRPAEFLKRYLEIDPDFANLLRSEFNMEV